MGSHEFNHTLHWADVVHDVLKSDAYQVGHYQNICAVPVGLDPLFGTLDIGIVPRNGSTDPISGKGRHVSTPQ
jgi:hypothetical protein